MLKLDLQQAYNTICGEIGHLELQRDLLDEQIAQKKQAARAMNQVRAMATPWAPPKPPNEETPDVSAAAVNPAPDRTT